MNPKAIQLGEQKATLRGKLVCAAVSAGIHFELPLKQRALEAVELADAVLEAMAAHLHIFSDMGDADMCLECGAHVEGSKSATMPQKVYVLSALNIGRGLHCVIAVETLLGAAMNIARMRFGAQLTWAEHDGHGKMWVDANQNYTIEEFKVDHG